MLIGRTQENREIDISKASSAREYICPLVRESQHHATQDIDIQMSKKFVDNLVEILYHRSFDGLLASCPILTQQPRSDTLY